MAQGERVGDGIHRTTDAMKNVADAKIPVRGHRLLDAEASDVLATFRVVFSGHFIWVTLEKNPKGAIKQLKVMTRPR
jgi:hypothetical protein